MSNQKRIRELTDKLNSFDHNRPSLASTLAQGAIRNEIDTLKAQDSDYRLWPNVLALNEAIYVLDRRIEECQVETERMALKNRRHELASKRYDQIQFNKEMFRKETA